MSSSSWWMSSSPIIIASTRADLDFYLFLISTNILLIRSVRCGNSPHPCGRRRYKLVVTVTMGERYMQGMKSIAQFLWDPEKDSYVSCIYDASPSLFAVATIYAIYFE
ncbi:conserved hypothetical protein [Culex quinquefasciatus]|uniref:Uncharacterized protein n=1 Tax=Culex quinquefasciatus TaxID=7176 RepID=B0WE72_CULQU|nr:conserved hypothetical protein [Culex quinquefasciatus]|eukprot:XP_001847006.1 conserved hypothetical protein [Culex quinquefasciatus]